eukprot:gnl/Chilomastix_cuspidata/851.p1 GENE.gnl/Chilomastix_cuspidata/851~~gnl/Chilomastix_cuspidata/851.p1  ORF type:complete len:948 (+),score=198.17 gnl/Chilomastix_cuspidata/851:629-3472(+)
MEERNVETLLDAIKDREHVREKDIPLLRLDIMNMILRQLELFPNPKQIQLSCVLVAILCRKPENRVRFLNSDLACRLAEFCSLPNTFTTNCPAYFFRLLLVTCFETYAVQTLFRPELIAFYIKVLESGNVTAILQLASVLDYLSIQEDFAKYAKENLFIRAVLEAINRETLPLFKFISKLCTDADALEIIVEEGAVDALHRACEDVHSLFEEQTAFATLVFVASSSAGAHQLNDSGVLIEYLRTIESEHAKMDLVSFIFHAINLTAFSENGLPPPGDDVLRALGRIAVAEVAPAFESTVGAILGLSLGDECLMALGRLDLLSIAYELTGQEGVDCDRFLHGIHDAFLRAADLGSPSRVSSIAADLFAHRLAADLHNEELWRFGCVMIQGGAADPMVPVLVDALKETSESTQNFHTLVYTCTLAMVLFFPDAADDLLPHVPRNFIDMLLSTEQTIPTRVASPFDTRVELPGSEANLLEVVNAVSPNAFFCALCGAHHSELAVQAKSHEDAVRVAGAWVQTPAGFHDYKFVPRMEKFAAKNETWKYLEISELEGPIARSIKNARVLEHALDMFGFVDQCAADRNHKATLSSNLMIDAVYTCHTSAEFADAPELVEASYNAVWLLSRPKSIKLHLLEIGFVDKMFADLAAYKDVPRILRNLLRALWMAFTRKANASYGLTKGIFEPVLAATIAHKHDKDTLQAGLNVLTLMTQNIRPKEEAAFMTSGALDFVSDLVLSDSRFQVSLGAETLYTFFCLDAVKEQTPQCYERVGAAVFQAARTCTDLNRFFTDVLKLLRVFASHPETWARTIDDGIVPLLCEVVQKFVEIPVALAELVLRILSKLVVHDKTHKPIYTSKLVAFFTKLVRTEVIMRSPVVEELFLKITYLITTRSRNGQKKLKRGRTARSLSKYISQITRPEMKHLAAVVSSRKTHASDVDIVFPRTGSREDF